MTTTQRLQARLETLTLRAAMALPEPVQRLLGGRPIVRDGLTLAAETQLMLRLQQVSGLPGAETVPIPQGREILDRQSAMVGGSLPVGEVRDLVAAGLPARLYTPINAAPTTGLLVFLHGGGFMYGGLASHDAPCRFLAERAGVRVLALDYRMGPEHPFPAAYDDAVAAYRWVVDNAAALGADPERLAVGGDSAGGNLAAGVAIEAARAGLPLAWQMLIYPATDNDRHTRSSELFDEGFYLTRRFRELATESYLPDSGDLLDPRASPAYADVPAGARPGLRGHRRLRPAARRGGGLRLEAPDRRRQDDPAALPRPDPRLPQRRRRRTTLARRRGRDRGPPQGRPRLIGHPPRPVPLVEV